MRWLIVGLTLLCFGMAAAILTMAVRLPAQEQRQVAESPAVVANVARDVAPVAPISPVAPDAGTTTGGSTTVPESMPEERAREAEPWVMAGGPQLVGLLDGDSFSPGHASLDRRGRALVATSVARLMPLAPGALVLVEGHTDSQPIRNETVGAFKDNAELSLQRARAVAQALAAEGVHEGRMRVRGWGDTRPLVGNDTAEGAARNRRVEILLLPGVAE